MAFGTAASRATGLLRILALGYALGFNRVADAFNLANTIPNSVYDVVLGGVVTATFLPIFVDRLATRSPREAWKAISSVTTLAVIVLVLATGLLYLAAPFVVDAFTALAPAAHGHAASALARQRQLATELLRWLSPQLLFYGLIATTTTLLNLRRRFGAPAWTPVANNVVCIAVLLWMAQVNGHPTLANVHAHPNQVLVLGLGTAAGVAVQAALLAPSYWRADLGRVRWRFDLRHEAVRTTARLGAWTLGFVVANQVALFVVMALAFHAGGRGPVSAYTYAWVFFQAPYAIVAVSVMNALTPELAEHHATGDVEGFKQRAAGGLRAVGAIVIPVTVLVFILAKPAMALLLGHGASSTASTATTAKALAALILGLPGFTAFQYAVRMMQAMQRQRDIFFLYLAQNAMAIVLAFAMVGGLGVTGLCLAITISYSACALGAFAYLVGELGPIGTPATWLPLRRVALASGAMALSTLIAASVSDALSGPAAFGRIALALLVGGLTYLAVIWLLGARNQRNPRQHERRG